MDERKQRQADGLLEKVPNETAARTLARAAMDAAIDGKLDQAEEMLGYAKGAAILVVDEWTRNDTPALTRDQGLALAGVLSADVAIDSLRRIAT